MKTVADLLRAKPPRGIIKVSPELSVLEAIKVLATENVGAAIVMTGDRLAGILSERGLHPQGGPQGPLVRRDAGRGDHDRQRDRGEPAHQDARVHGADDGEEHPPPARSVDEGRVVGMVSIRDIVSDIIADQDFTIEQLEHYISGQ
jgi:CBS domain-containing protein